MPKILAKLSIRQRITILVVTALVGVCLFSLVQGKKEADFKPLFTGLASEDAAGIVQKLRESELRESGAEYRLADGGGSVLVPSGRRNKLRLTLPGTSASQASSMELMSLLPVNPDLLLQSRARPLR